MLIANENAPTVEIENNGENRRLFVCLVVVFDVCASPRSCAQTIITDCRLH